MRRKHYQTFWPTWWPTSAMILHLIIQPKTEHVQPDAECTSSTTILLRADMSEPEPDMRVDGPIQLGVTQQGCLPSSVLRVYGLGQVPPQNDPLSSSQRLGNVPAGTIVAVEEDPLYIGTGQVFRLEAVGTTANGLSSWHPWAASFSKRVNSSSLRAGTF